MEYVKSLGSKNVQTKETPNNNVPKTVVQPQISELSDEQIGQVSNDLEDLELDLGGGLYIKNLDETLPPMLHVAKTKYDNKTFSGQIHQLFRIREALLSSASTRLVNSM